MHLTLGSGEWPCGGGGGGGVFRWLGNARDQLLHQVTIADLIWMARLCCSLILLPGISST